MIFGQICIIVSLIYSGVNYKVFCRVSKWRIHGWAQLREPRWEQDTVKHFVLKILYKILYTLLLWLTQTSEMAGYQVGRPVIAGILDTVENNTGSVQRMPINLWKAGNRFDWRYGQSHFVDDSMSPFMQVSSGSTDSTPFSDLLKSEWWSLFHCWEETNSVWGEFNIRMSASCQSTESDSV